MRHWPLFQLDLSDEIPRRVKIHRHAGAFGPAEVPADGDGDGFLAVSRYPTLLQRHLPIMEVQARAEFSLYGHNLSAVSLDCGYLEIAEEERPQRKLPD